MVAAEDLCKCMEDLIAKGKISQHVPPYTHLADGTIAEDGELCMVNHVAEDYGYYDEYQWVSNIVSYIELYPIKYCPICGKQIVYKKYNSLTKRR